MPSVFLSSTYQDLVDHRREVDEVLRRMRQNSVVMEYFGSRTDDAIEVCKNEIDRSDIVVGIYAHRYGWIPPGSAVSITEMEFDYARRQGKKILCYVVDENHPWPPKFIEGGEAYTKLTAFKQKVGQLVRTVFTTPDDLAKQVAADLAREISTPSAAPVPPVPARTIPGRTPLGDYHRHTCDRVDQNDRFLEKFESNRAQKAHFFYLYGGKKQAHKSLYKRVAYYLEGKLEDYLDTTPQTAQGNMPRVLHFDKPLTFSFSKVKDIYQKNILKSFFSLLEVPANENEPITQKNLRFVYDNSPLLQGLGPKDYVCVYVQVSHLDWDKISTPETARWFMGEFCHCELPADGPMFLFFFGILYDEVSKPQLVEEVRAAVTQAEYVEPLPELGMVHIDDIERWLYTYSISDTSSDIDRIKQDRFGNQPEHFMEEVERQLQQIIDEYNAGKI